ncbi:MAG TPA: GIY-YIG nuclease family protein [Terriglobales bacterium]|nr:GIY-YIG nuclease family protein [Terriglobales bacterium]
MKERRSYSVYIVANATRVLYTGMTSGLEGRIWEHKEKVIKSFTSNFHVCRLVYWESFDDVRKAIDREKQIKGWRREKKIRLIESINPNWHDRSDGWYDKPKGLGMGRW